MISGTIYAWKWLRCMIMTFWKPKIDLNNNKNNLCATYSNQNNHKQTISHIQPNQSEIKSRFQTESTLGSKTYRSIQCNSRLHTNTGKGLTFHLAFQAAEETNESAEAHPCLFDSDSFTIHVDNCASRCMTNCINHFISPPNNQHPILR